MVIRYRITYIDGKSRLYKNIPLFLEPGEIVECINWIEEPPIKDWNTYRVAISNMCTCGNRIEAIKLCKITTGWDLQTAKTYVDKKFPKP